MEILPHPSWQIAVIVAAIIAEAVWRRRAQRGYDFRAAGASFGIATGNILLKPVTAMIPTIAFLGAEMIAPIHLPLDAWGVWIAGFFVVEFAYYWFHRWSHTIRWMWASHAVHHSAEEYTLPAAIRLGWTGVVSGGWAVFIPVVLVGFPATLVATLLAGNLTYQFFLHSEAVGRLGPLEWIFNTPAHHRVHHASNPAYLDRNFGGVLIVYDRLFGTFAKLDSDNPTRYGLTKPINSQNVFAINFREWGALCADVLQSTNWRERFSAMFGRPP